MNIDWSQLITKAMKDAAAQAALLAAARTELLARNNRALIQIANIQDRIDTLGYGIEAGEATLDDEVERDTLLISIAIWKGYKFSLGKVIKQTGWPTSVSWPEEPVAPIVVMKQAEEFQL